MDIESSGLLFENMLVSLVFILSLIFGLTRPGITKMYCFSFNFKGNCMYFYI